MDEDPDVTFQQIPTTLSRRLLDGVLLLPAGQDEPIHMTRSGGAIWLWLEEPITMHELADAVSSVFEVSVDTILADVEPVLAELVEVGAISMTATTPR